MTEIAPGEGHDVRGAAGAAYLDENRCSTQEAGRVADEYCPRLAGARVGKRPGAAGGDGRAAALSQRFELATMRAHTVDPRDDLNPRRSGKQIRAGCHEWRSGHEASPSVAWEPA